jgi:hypothetical protein
MRGNASGTGTIILESPSTNTSSTITLPDATTTLVGTDATQTLTNKTITGATISGSTIQGGTLTLVSGGNLTGAATDFTGIPSWVKRVTIFVSSASTSGTSNKLLQIGSGTIQTTGYVASCMTCRNGGAGFGSTSTNGFTIDNDSLATYIYDGTIELINASGNTWFIESMLADTTGIRGPIGTGRVALSGALDRFRFTTAGGADTYDGGSFTVMYEG